MRPRTIPLSLRPAQRLSDYLAPRLLTQILQELRVQRTGLLAVQDTLVLLHADAPPATLLVPTADGPDLPQHDPPLRCTNPTFRQLGVLPLRLRPYEEASQLLGRNPRRSRPAERVEEELAFHARSKHSAAEETKGFLGGVAAVYEMVVESVACIFALARPQECFVGVGEGGMEDVRGWVGFGPGDLV